MRAFACSLVILSCAACGSSDPQIPTYVVAYHVTKTTVGPLTCDSVQYEDAAGQIVKVVSPALPWSVAITAQSGSYIQARAWITASAGGQTAKLKMTWTISGVSTAADSSMGTSTAANKFELAVARRQL
jgi:hypothetical protein